MNGKLEFIYQFDEVSPTITMTLSPESTLSEVIGAFEQFLKGAGYQLDFISYIPCEDGNVKVEE